MKSSPRTVRLREDLEPPLGDGLGRRHTQAIDDRLVVGQDVRDANDTRLGPGNDGILLRRQCATEVEDAAIRLVPKVVGQAEAHRLTPVVEEAGLADRAQRGVVPAQVRSAEPDDRKTFPLEDLPCTRELGQLRMVGERGVIDVHVPVHRELDAERGVRR